LAQVAIQPAQAAFHLAEITDFFAKFHKNSRPPSVVSRQ
jgi:hypothetical protein